MNLQMTAERERRAAVARAEGEREAAIKSAEGEKQALILRAEGRQLAAMRDAEARVALARGGGRGDADGVRRGGGAFGQAGLHYFIADRYVRAFQALASAPNSRLVVVPMESTALAGGITQALELLRGGDGSSGIGPPDSAASLVITATATSLPIVPPSMPAVRRHARRQSVGNRVPTG